MKKTIFILSLIFCPSLFAATMTTNIVPYTCQGGASPQLCDSSIATSNGNIGIGTTSPSFPLSINNSFGIKLDLNGGTQNGIDFESGQGGDGFYLYSYNTGLGLYDTSSTNQPLTITNGGDVYSNAWQDYSPSTTASGWGNISQEWIFTKKIGKTVFVNFYIYGTSGGSNATTATFTLPYPQDTSCIQEVFMANGIDNGTWTSTAYGVTSNNPNNTNAIITVYKSTGGGAWTSSGTKLIEGQFWYQSI